MSGAIRLGSAEGFIALLWAAMAGGALRHLRTETRETEDRIRAKQDDGGLWMVEVDDSKVWLWYLCG
jgi:hypothetical protein